MGVIVSKEEIEVKEEIKVKSKPGRPKLYNDMSKIDYQRMYIAKNTERIKQYRKDYYKKTHINSV